MHVHMHIGTHMRVLHTCAYAPFRTHTHTHTQTYGHLCVCSAPLSHCNTLSCPRFPDPSLNIKLKYTLDHLRHETLHHLPPQLLPASDHTLHFKALTTWPHMTATYGKAVLLWSHTPQPCTHLLSPPLLLCVFLAVLATALRVQL